MQYFKMILLTLTLSTSSLVFTACGGSSDTTEQQGKEYTSTYVCPMHCEGSGSDEAGKCPVCGMDYVENEKHKADGHSH